MEACNAFRNDILCRHHTNVLPFPLLYAKDFTGERFPSVVQALWLISWLHILIFFIHISMTFLTKALLMALKCWKNWPHRALEYAQKWPFWSQGCAPGFSTMDSTLSQSDQSHRNGNFNAHFGRQVTWFSRTSKTSFSRSYIHHEWPSGETTLVRLIFPLTVHLKWW